MTTHSKTPSTVNTGGGAFISGEARGDIVGRDQVKNVVTGSSNVITQQPGLDPESFLRLLTEMLPLVHQAGLDERKARTLEGDLKTVEEEAQAPQPDGGFLVGRLEGITHVLKSAGNLTEAGQKLLPLAGQALVWAKGLFG
jgi:hypothetical protein